MTQYMSVGGLTAIQAEQMNMSIRLASDGLTFAISYNARPQEIFTRGHLPLGYGYRSWSEAVRELFYAHPELSLPYRQVDLYYEPMYSVLVPEELYDPADPAVWLRTIEAEERVSGDSYVYLGRRIIDEEKVIVSAWYADLYQFVHRTHLQLHTHPYYMPVLERRKLISRQRSGAELCMLIRPEGVDCFILQAGELIFLNSFTFVNTQEQTDLVGELTYYTFSIWRSMGLSTTESHLYLSYPLGAKPEESPLRATAERLCGELSSRLAHIETEALSWL